MKKEKLNELTGEFEQVEVVNENLPSDINIEPNISFVPTKIKFNYDELKSVMVQGLEDYKIEVNQDNLKEANKTATKLNKLATTIKRARIDNKKDMLLPINEFEVKMKDLEDTALKGREFILNQVEVFNNETKVLCNTLLNEYLAKELEKVDLDDEFKNIEISDLVIVSNISNGKLVKKAKDTINSRIAIEISKQTNKKMRLMMLENECLKAGLKVLLNENDVSSFILESDLKYNEMLSSLITREVEKQKQIELNFEIQKQREEEQKQQLKEVEDRKQKEQEETKKQIVEDRQKETGKKTVTVVATFDVEVNIDIEDSKVFDKFEKSLSEQYPNSFKMVTPF